MSFQQFAAEAARDEIAEREKRDQADASFRRRLKGQRFLRDFAPVISAMVRAGVEDDLFPGTLHSLTARVDAMAASIAATMSTDPAQVPTAATVTGYRRQAAMLVAEMWTAKRYNDATVISAIGKSIRSVIGEEDEIPELGGGASLRVTMIPIQVRFVEIATRYDFRLGVDAVARAMSDEVRQRALDMVEALSDSHATPVDRRTMFQTCARSLSGTMEAVYRRTCQHYLRRLVVMDESEKLDVLDRERPFERIVSEFRQRVETVKAIVASSTIQPVEPQPPTDEKRVTEEPSDAAQRTVDRAPAEEAATPPKGSGPADGLSGGKLRPGLGSGLGMGGLGQKPGGFAR